MPNYHPIIQTVIEATNHFRRWEKNPQLVYEAHSTDYQTSASLKEMVRDHFAILKVGPALTFAYREAIFALAMMENEFFAKDEHSNLIDVLDRAILENPAFWKKYYQRHETFKRKFSLSDRIRYYWGVPMVQDALKKLFLNWGNVAIPRSLLSQFAPCEYGETEITAFTLIERKIENVLRSYEKACYK